jgi:hypothetical protein
VIINTPQLGWSCSLIVLVCVSVGVCHTIHKSGLCLFSLAVAGIGGLTGLAKSSVAL